MQWLNDCQVLQSFLIPVHVLAFQLILYSADINMYIYLEYWDKALSLV